MTPVIHFISDLHLCEEQPKLFELFEHYITTIAPDSDQLFVLGDLFEVWVGDDHHTSFNDKVIALFSQYANNHGELFVGHGNRDFLMGEAFAQSCGAKLISEPFNFEWSEKKLCLMHGDSLCTDDVPYQQLRQMIRGPEWQQEFLSQSVEARLAFASSVREQSKTANKTKAAEIMDVNLVAVKETIKANDCDWLIHGHTHRPDVHDVEIESNDHKRIVLSDWRDEGHYLVLQDGEFKNHYFAAP